MKILVGPKTTAMLKKLNSWNEETMMEDKPVEIKRFPLTLLRGDSFKFDGETITVLQTGTYSISAGKVQLTKKLEEGKSYTMSQLLQIKDESCK